MRNLIDRTSLSTKILVLFALIVLTVAGVNLFQSVTAFRTQSLNLMIEKADAFTAVAEGTKSHTSDLVMAGDFDTAALVRDLEETLAAGKDYTEAKIFKTIPVVAAWTSAEIAAEREGIEFYVPAFDARNPANEPAADPVAGAFRAELLRELEAKFEAGEATTVSRINEETGKLHVMRAIELTQSCMACHGEPGHPMGDPDGDGVDILGFPMERWAVGDMHGAFEVVKPLDEMNAQIAAIAGRQLGVAALVILGGSGLFVLVMRAIVGRPIAGIVGMFERMGRGDLTERWEGTRRDEIGKLGAAFNSLATSLGDVVNRVRQGSERVASASTQVAASSEQMSASLSDQTRQVGDVAAAALEMSESVKSVSERANSTTEHASRAGEVAEGGAEVVAETVREVGQIAEKISASAATIAGLETKSEQIGEILGVITEIAEQTNLLALNAAIEAARAGEHGRGFAVVADEVRKLAERTQDATQQVSTAVREIQAGTREAVGSMESNRSSVMHGVELAGRAGDALKSIVEGSREVAAGIESIAAAAQEQTAAGEEISRGLDHVSRASQESSDGSQQAAQAASDLSRAAEELRDTVSVFKV